MKAAVAIPTQRRASYLEVALASVMTQARAAGAEVLVVDDGPDEATRAAAERHGARYVRHDASRGLNAARNTALAATDAELVCFLDDDVEVHMGWLAALLAAAGACPDEVAVLTGPIHARFEGHRFRTCGREGPPVTFLDLGPDDRDCDHAWGANMAVRRSAVQRAGPFDETRELYGDEQEWQARVRAAGGRIRYVADAALDHRRTGDDARLRSLCRAAYRRGQASRRFDVFKGSAPSLVSELRVLGGCALHGPRRACMNGPVLTAHSLGRLRATLSGRATGGGWAGRLRAALAAPVATTAAPDFLSGASGTVGGKRGLLLRARDRWLDAREGPRRARLRRAAEREPPRRRVLVLGIERPGSLMPAARQELLRSRHAVDVVTAPAGERGKFENLDALLAEHPPAAYDWVLVVDDDVALPRGFLDAFLCAAERAGLRLAQPAHRLHSHAAWEITRRRPGSTVRETTFVEIGPVTAFHRDAVAELLPFPAGLRMGWGLDVHWAAVAAERGWPIGIVDATPIGHTQSPAASGYSREAAEREARAFLDGRAYVRRDEVRTVAVHR
ncbi:MAG TPA: glycosyltransferase [Solirubrobacteraceae bacterium]